MKRKVEFLDEEGYTKAVGTLLADDTELSIENVVKRNNKVKVTWSEDCTGKYQLQYREKNNSWKNAGTFTDKTSWSTSKLKKGKTYEFRVRPVTESYWWSTQYGPWSDVFGYKVK